MSTPNPAAIARARVSPPSLDLESHWATHDAWVEAFAAEPEPRGRWLDVVLALGVMAVAGIVVLELLS